MYRWIYTQFINNDLFVNIILHFGSMFGENNIPYVSYGFHNRKSGYTEHKRILIEKEKLPEFEKSIFFDQNKVSIQVDTFCLEGSASIYYSDKANPINIVETENSPIKDGYWSIRIPYGVFAGTIRINDQNLVFSATIYQDEQWGVSPLLPSIKEWVWAVISEESQNWGVFSILPTNGRPKWYKWQCSKNDYVCTFSIDYDFPFSSVLNNKETPIRINNFSYSINYSRALRQRYHEVYGAYYFNYFRYLLFDEFDKIKGVCELMSTNK